MPKGLPDIIQKFGADNADYLRKLNENKEAIRGEVESLEEHRRAVERNQRAVEEFADDLEDLRRKLEAVEAARSRNRGGDLLGVGNIARAADDMDRLSAAQRDFLDSGRGVTVLAASYDKFTDKAEKAYAKLQETGQILRDFKSVGDALTYGVLDNFKRVKEQHDASLMTVKQLQAAQAELANNIRQTGSEAVVAGARAGQAWADYHRDANKAVMLMRQLNAEHRVLAGGGGGAAGALRVLRGGGAGAGAAGAYLADVFGGGGGVGGDGGLMNAAAYADNIVNFAKRWAGAAHYAVMGTMEALSTIIPATVAFGAASLVGMQGAEQLINRGQAIRTTAEALGPAYRTSAGQMIGLGGGLQAAQNQYQGGVYGLTGGLMNLISGGPFGAGGGTQGGFLGMGGATLAMMDRGVADMIVNARARGTAGTLGTILGGGTGYLRQFGDIGANLGNFLLGMAPNLPGVGGDILSALTGVTGAMSWGAGNIPGPFLGAGLATEAGWRLGTPLLGLAGRGLTGLGGLAGRVGLGTAGASLKDLMKIFPDVSKAELAASGLVGEGGAGLAGALGTAGGVLGAFTGPEAALLAASVYGMSKLASTMPTKEMRQIAAMQAGLPAVGFTSAVRPLAALASWASTQQAGVPTTGFAGMVAQGYPMMETPSQYARFGPGSGMGPSAAQAYQNVTSSAVNTIASIDASAQQLVPALDKMGIHGASFADALQIGEASLLDWRTAFDPKTGKLTAGSIQQVADFVKAVTGAKMTAGGQMVGGVQMGAAAPLMAAAAAQTIMGSSTMKSLQNVNQAMDSMTQIMTGGLAGPAALFGMLGGTPVTHTRAGLRLAAGFGPGTGAFAQALKSPFTAGGAAAWSTFAGPQGMIPTEQQNLDQLRTEMALGALSTGGGARLGAFQLEQLLPLAQHSPAALAALMSMGMQMGIPGMQYFKGSATSGRNLARQYAAAAAAIGGFAPSGAGALSLTNQAAVSLANLPNVAGGFIQGLAPSVASALGGDAIQQALSLRTHPGSLAAVHALAADLQAQGVSRGQLGGTAAALLGQVGAGKQAQHMVAQGVINWVNKTQPLGHQKASGSVMFNNTTKHLGMQHADGLVQYHNKVTAPSIPTLHGTIVYHAVLIGAPGGGAVGGLGGTTSGMGRAQTGAYVPDRGAFGDVNAYMLERGELVVPRRLVNAGAVDHLRGRIPGFQEGGMAGGGFEVPFLEGLNMLGVSIRTAMIGFGQSLMQGIQQDFNGFMSHSGMMSIFAGTDLGSGRRIAGGGGGGGGTFPPGGGAAVLSGGGGGAAGVTAPLQKSLQSASFDKIAVTIIHGIDKSIKTVTSGGQTLAEVKAQINAEWKILDKLYSERNSATGAQKASIQDQINQVWKILDPLYKQEDVLKAGGGGSKAASSLSALAQQVAKSIAQQFQQEIAYVNQTAQSVSSGLWSSLQAPAVPNVNMHAAAPGTKGYNPAQWNAYVAAYASDSLPGGANATPSVQDQMKSYLASIRQFSKDLGTLGKGGLNKGIIQQLVSAGPVQGDALAQSILGGQGGIKAANALWKSIQQASQGLGIMAANLKYGGKPSTTVLGGQFSGGGNTNVTINVSIGGSTSGGDLNLTTRQLNQLVREIQKKLLQQAKRNRKTGVSLPGHGT